MKKICTKCNIAKELKEFYKWSYSTDGYSSWCIACSINYKKDHQKEKQIYMKNYRKNNLKKITEYQKTYREINKENIKQKNKNYRNSPAKFHLFYDKIKKYEECRQDPNNPELLQVKCKYCNNWFNPTYSQLNSRLKIMSEDKRSNNLYCSNACKKSCPIFGKHKYPRDFKQNTSREVQPELRKLVLERDNWTCQKCGKNKKDNLELELHCHHILPLNEDPIQSADIDNCITLCKDCHNEVHKTISGCNYSELKCSN